MARPSEIDIIEAYEDERGSIQFWAIVDGHEMHFQLAPGTLVDRKLGYGHAEVVVEEVRQGENRITINDLVDDAEEQALKHIIEENLDRWEKFGVNWKEFEAPPRASQAGHARTVNYTRLTRLEKKYTGIRRKAPDKPEMRVRKVGIGGNPV